MNKKIFLDFDGVMNDYQGWQGEDVLFSPREGLEEFLQQLSQKFKIYIFTARNKDNVQNWVDKNNLSEYIQDVTDKKEPAYLYIDDRAISFDGDYDKTVAAIEKFEPYWRNIKKETI